MEYSHNSLLRWEEREQTWSNMLLFFFFFLLFSCPFSGICSPSYDIFLLAQIKHCTCMYGCVWWDWVVFDNAAQLTKAIKLYLQRTSILPFQSQNLTSNSLHWLPFNSYDVSLENLVLDQLMIPKFLVSFILFTVCLILYWYCIERLCLGHSWEYKG